MARRLLDLDACSYAVAFVPTRKQRYNGKRLDMLHEYIPIGRLMLYTHFMSFDSSFQLLIGYVS